MPLLPSVSRAIKTAFCGLTTTHIFKDSTSALQLEANSWASSIVLGVALFGLEIGPRFTNPLGAKITVAGGLVSKSWPAPDKDLVQSVEQVKRSYDIFDQDQVTT